jgi:hypothetical protein
LPKSKNGNGLQARVARWFIFKPKIQIWVNLGGPWSEKVGIFCDHLAIYDNLLPIWFISPRFGLLLKKNLATLLQAPD